MRRIVMISLTVLATLATGSAFAQVEPAPTPTEPKPPRIVYPKNETIIFDTITITDTVPHPAGAIILVRPHGSFDAMIPERAHFKAELAKSAVDLR